MGVADAIVYLDTEQRKLEERRGNLILDSRLTQLG
jgi:hypothetical protein